MEEVELPKTSTNRQLKSTSKDHCLDEDRVRFVEEEYDFLCNEIAAWLSGLCGKEIDANLAQSLKTGTVLCSIVRDYIPSVPIPKYREDTSKNAFYARDNIKLFSDACQKMGISKNDCLSYDMFEKENRKQIVNCILRFAIIGIKYGLKPINVIHSDRLKNFIEAMPTEMSSSISNLMEEKAEETTDGTTEGEQPEKEKVGLDAEDKRNMCILIVFMISVLIGMFYIANKLQSLQWIVC